MRCALCLLVLALAACGSESGTTSSGTSTSSSSCSSDKPADSGPSTSASATGTSSAAPNTPAAGGPDATPRQIPADVPTSLDGEEIRYGIGVEGGKRLKSVSVGVSFVVPSGWTGTQGAGGYMLSLLPPSNEQVNMSGQGLLGGVWIGLSGVGDDNLRAMLSLSIPLPIGQYTLVFEPEGKPQVDGNVYTQTYTAQTFYGPFRARSVAVRGAAGNAMLATVSGSDDRKARLKDVCDELASSARFARPQDAERRNGAIQLLAGRRLLKMESHYNRSAGGSTTSRTTDASLDLYADGNYVYAISTSHDTSTPHGGASGSAQSGARGRWWIVIGHATEFLVLEPEGAPVQSHAITIQNGSLFISGQKVAITSIG